MILIADRTFIPQKELQELKIPWLTKDKKYPLLKIERSEIYGSGWGFWIIDDVGQEQGYDSKWFKNKLEEVVPLTEIL